jgi:hypothetical protein
LCSRFGGRTNAVVPYQVQSVLDGTAAAWPLWSNKAIENDPHHVFLLGRQYEQRVDASALRADEGRGIAAISVGEPRAGVDPTISEWGNPIVVKR